MCTRPSPLNGVMRWQNNCLSLRRLPHPTAGAASARHTNGCEPAEQASWKPFGLLIRRVWAVRPGSSVGAHALGSDSMDVSGCQLLSGRLASKYWQQQAVSELHSLGPSCLPGSDRGAGECVLAPQQDDAAHQDEDQEQHEPDEVGAESPASPASCPRYGGMLAMMTGTAGVIMWPRMALIIAGVAGGSITWARRHTPRPRARRHPQSGREFRAPGAAGSSLAGQRVPGADAARGSDQDGRHAWLAAPSGAWRGAGPMLGRLRVPAGLPRIGVAGGARCGGQTGGSACSPVYLRALCDLPRSHCIALGWAAGGSRAAPAGSPASLRHLARLCRLPRVVGWLGPSTRTMSANSSSRSRAARLSP
jgi:hypothetical protein